MPNIAPDRATSATLIWRTTQARIATWFGFILMCLGMFMAILDIQVVATSLPTIQDALAISPDAMSWIQTAYLIAEVIAIPLTGWLTRALTLRWLFVIAIFVFTLTSVGCAFSSNFASLVTFRIFQGFSGGTLIPAVFSGIFLLFPARSHPVAGTMAGIVAGAGADGRTGGRRLDHAPLFLALAVSGQRRPGRHRGGRDAVPAAARQASSEPAEEFRRNFSRADGGGIGEPGDRFETGAAIWLVLRRLLWSVCALRRRGGPLCSQDAEGGAAGGRARNC